VDQRGAVSSRASPSMNPAPLRISAPMLLWNTTRGIRFFRIAAARPSSVLSASASGSAVSSRPGAPRRPRRRHGSTRPRSRRHAGHRRPARPGHAARRRDGRGCATTGADARPPDRASARRAIRRGPSGW
jgi:hypothetical protein